MRLLSPARCSPFCPALQSKLASGSVDIVIGAQLCTKPVAGMASSSLSSSMQCQLLPVACQRCCHFSRHPPSMITFQMSASNAEDCGSAGRPAPGPSVPCHPAVTLVVCHPAPAYLCQLLLALMQHAEVTLRWAAGADISGCMEALSSSAQEVTWMLWLCRNASCNA